MRGGGGPGTAAGTPIPEAPRMFAGCSRQGETACRMAGRRRGKMSTKYEYLEALVRIAIPECYSGVLFRSAIPECYSGVLGGYTCAMPPSTKSSIPAT
jgi:hypothetical protein